MTWPRIRNIALSQLRALKDRLDGIDAEIEDDRLRAAMARRDAERELDVPAGFPAPDPPNAAVTSVPESGPQSVPVAETPEERVVRRHCKVLNVPESAPLSEIEVAYRQLIERLDAIGSDIQTDASGTVEQIRQRVDEAYLALRAARNPVAGRFDKLEL